MASPFKLLLEIFRARFLENETEGTFDASVYQIVGAIATPGLLVTLFVMPLFMDLATHTPGPDVDWLIRGVCLFFPAYSFAVTGFATLFEWDVLSRPPRLPHPRPVSHPPARVIRREIRRARRLHSDPGRRREFLPDRPVAAVLHGDPEDRCDRHHPPHPDPGRRNRRRIPLRVLRCRRSSGHLDQRHHTRDLSPNFARRADVRHEPHGDRAGHLSALLAFITAHDGSAQGLALALPASLVHGTLRSPAARRRPLVRTLRDPRP